MTPKYPDIKQSFLYFFRLKDWKSRTFFTGVVPFLLALLYIFPLILILALKEIGLIIAIFLFLIIYLIIFIYRLILSGYQLELIDNLRLNLPINEIRPERITKSRIILGLKIYLINFIYSLPVAFFTLIYIVSFIPMFFFDEKGPEGILLVIFFALMFIGIIASLLSSAFTFLFAYGINPATIYLFLKNKSIKEAFQIKKVFEFIKNNIINLILLFAIVTILNIVLQLAFYVSILLMIILIGFIIFIGLVALTNTITLHLSAYYYAEIYRLNDKGKRIDFKQE